MFYTRRPPTLSINELNHIISESLDIDRFEHVNVPDTILHDPLPSTPEKPKTSTFHRLFSRSSSQLPLVPHSPVDEPVTPSPRKMTFTWRLSRLSPHGSRRAEDHAVRIRLCTPTLLFMLCRWKTLLVSHRIVLARRLSAVSLLPFYHLRER
jgi:hypothetical protein